MRDEKKAPAGAERKKQITTVLSVSVTEEIPEYKPTASHQSSTGSLTSTYRVVIQLFLVRELSLKREFQLS